MTIDFTHQAEEMLKAAKVVRIPANVNAFVQESVTKTRDAYEKISALTKDQALVANDVVLAAQAGVRKLGQKVLANASANTEAVFDAAAQIARAKTWPEVARLQADFVRQQYEVVGAQTKELFELSSEVAKGTIESINAAATKSFAPLKNAG